MRSIISKTMLLFAIAATLLSFSPNFGGEGFEITLNGKIILQQFGKDMNSVKNIQLTHSAPGDKLGIRYYHCGRIGKNRIVAIKDGKDKLLKEWRFSDATAPGDMCCQVKEIYSLRESSNVLKLYYSSSELPEGRMLTLITIGNSAIANR